MTEPTTSVSLTPIGGLELLGKQRKEFAGGEGPQRAERAGASESLGWGEGALRVQGSRKIPSPEIPAFAHKSPTIHRKS